jgi:hypothetical protein
MAMKNAIGVLSLLVVFAFGGCTKFLEFEGDNATPRLVINGVMYPDSSIQVTLTNSVGYLSTDGIEPQTSGVLSLYDEAGNLLEVLQHTGFGVYRGATTATVGSRYRLVAEHPGFDPVEASDVVPVPVPILSWDTATVEIDNPFETSTGREYRFTFADPPGEKNYYMLEVIQAEEFFINYIFNPNTGEFVPDTVWLDVPFFYPVGMNTTDQVIASENDSFLGETLTFGDQFFFSDNLFEGSTREFVVRVSEPFPGARYILRLSTLSEAYYRYRVTARRFLNTNGDPFAEPVLVFSNVEGGLGVFGGVSSSSVE